MVKVSCVFKVLAVFVFSFSALNAQTLLPAFPGAEGYGKYTTGGRGGKVIYVTNLEDNTSPGSLRYAINQTGARIIEFKVSGTIQLKSNLNIKNGDLTIAGQTAPGDGICTRDYPVVVEADNVVIRYMRFRMGDAALQQNDCLWGRDHSNIMIDHCTMTWSTDECASFYDNQNYTMQWCIVAESLHNSIHDKGAHGYGGIWGGQKASFHHNLLADNDSRNPRFCGSRYTNKPDLELVDFRNNLIYNWGGNSSYGAEGGNYNMVNNYFKAGPATKSNQDRIENPYPDDGSNSQPAGTYGHFYITGNVTTASSSTTNDNWLGVDLASQFSTYGIIKADLKSDTEFGERNVTTHSAQIAYEKVLDYAGASLVRDTVDRRIIHDARNGTATITDGGNGSTNGFIDTQMAAGGWPELNSLPAPDDSDNDGIPDVWEDANGLKKNDASDAQLTSVDGKYPNLEVYLNSLVAAITANQLKDALYTSAKTIQKPDNKVNILLNRSNGLLQISSDKMIRAVQIFSINGCLLNSKIVNTQNADLPENNLPDGVYIVSVRQQDGFVYSQKVVKSK